MLILVAEYVIFLYMSIVGIWWQIKTIFLVDDSRYSRAYNNVLIHCKEKLYADHIILQSN